MIMNMSSSSDENTYVKQNEATLEYAHFVFDIIGDECWPSIQQSVYEAFQFDVQTEYDVKVLDQMECECFTFPFQS